MSTDDILTQRLHAAESSPSPAEPRERAPRRLCVCGHGPAFHINGLPANANDLGACDHERCGCSWWTEAERAPAPVPGEK
jgi:hypothetical protein